MRPILLIVCCLLLAATVHAQEPIKVPDVVVYTHPLNFIDPNKPAMRLGLEVKVSEKMWVDTDVGYSPLARSGYRGRVEVKRSVTKRSYLSAGIFHHHYEYTDQPTWFASDEPELGLEFSPVGVTKLSTGGDLRFGYKWVVNKLVVIDPYVGMGAMATTRKHDGPDEYGIGSSFFGRRMQEGTVIYPRFAMGFRIGFALKR